MMDDSEIDIQNVDAPALVRLLDCMMDATPGGWNLQRFGAWIGTCGCTLYKFV